MKMGHKLLLGTAVVLGIPVLLRGAGAARKLADIEKNLVIKPGFSRIHGIDRKTGDFVAIFNGTIYNYSGFDINIENLYIVLDYQTGNSWSNLGISSKVEKESKLSNNSRVQLELPINLDVATFTGLVFNSPKTKIRMTTKYDVLGNQISYEEFFTMSDYIDLSSVTKIFNKKK